MMPISSRDLIRSTSAFLLIGFVALMGIVAMNFWLSERAQSYSEDAISARDTRVAAVELRNSMLAAESSQRGFLGRPPAEDGLIVAGEVGENTVHVDKELHYPKAPFSSA
jgi:hypothetical protein